MVFNLQIDWGQSLRWFLLFIAYAEIHFRFRFLPSRLFQKEPEIIFDLPHRGQHGKPIPLFLFVKDAHRFPIRLLEAKVNLTHVQTQKATHVQFPLQAEVTQKFFTKIFNLPAANFPQPGEYQVQVHLTYIDPAQKAKSMTQDNYRYIPHHPFSIFVSPYPLPEMENWYWGDLHVHSNYTDDQVEFGAPIAATVLAAQAVGLHFMAVTDHSYDLDDDPDNCLVNRMDIPKWIAFQKEIKSWQSEHPEFIVIPGEEVSTGNHRGRNIHCQILNDPQFHPGNGDSAERLFRPQPTQKLTELLEKKSRSALAIAAHPQEIPPLSQRIILKRGSWSVKDCFHEDLHALQILNNSSEKSLHRGVELWKQLLLNKRKIGIVAGNDAHGNFNCFRQIAIPFLSMVYKKYHLLGQVRTAVQTNQFDTSGILEAIRHMRMVISNGPLALIRVKGKSSAELGDEIPFPIESRLVVHGISIPEYGHWKELRLCMGDFQQKQEKIKIIPITRAKLEIIMEFDLKELSADYLRLEAYTQRNQYKYFCLTNPIWFIRE